MEDANDDDDEAVASEESSDERESIGQESESYIPFTRIAPAMEMPPVQPEWVVDCA